MNEDYVIAVIKLREFKSLIEVGPVATLYCAGLDEDLKEELLNLYYVNCDKQIARMESELAGLAED